MKRKTFLQQSLLTIAGVSLLPNTIFGQRFSNRGFMQNKATLTLLRDSVHIFSMSGGSIGVYLKEDYGVVIDSQYPDNAKEALKQLSEIGLAENMMLCNTHHHGDHTGGNDIFAEAGLSILAHSAVPTLMKKQAEERNRPLAAVPTDIFENSITKELGRETLKADHFGAGHTGGDAIYHFQEANIAHLGDLVFNDVFPFIDANGGGSIKGWINVLQQIESHYDSDTLFIFGHGKEVTGSIEDVKRKRLYLEQLLNEATKSVKAGVPKEAFKANESIVFENRNEMWNGARAMNLERAWEQAAAAVNE